MKGHRVFTAVGVVCVGALGSLLGPQEVHAFTVATFADPAIDASTPVITVDLANNVVSGGWSDAQNGLNLIIPGVGTFNNAFFTMTNLSYSAPGFIGVTDPGAYNIQFFANGADPNSVPPLVRIDFTTAQVFVNGLGGDDVLSGNNVVITGSAVLTPLVDESFAFSFANQTPLNGSFSNGMTATAAFTSSGVPEPAMLGAAMLLPLLMRRRRHA